MNKPNDLPAGVVNIKGKDYETVGLRIAKFRAQYPFWSIQTEVVYRDVNCVVMKAVISNEEGVIATGHAEEFRTDGKINETSAMENCETSAIGRALAFLGLSGSMNIPTAEEMRNAMDHKASTEDVLYQQLKDAAMEGTKSLEDVFRSIPKGNLKTKVWNEHKESLKECAAKFDAIELAGAM